MEYVHFGKKYFIFYKKIFPIKNCAKGACTCNTHDKKYEMSSIAVLHKTVMDYVVDKKLG